jgi:hypothetical protein
VGTHSRRECLDRRLIYHPRYLLAVLASTDPIRAAANARRRHGTGPALVDHASARAQRRMVLNELINEYSQAA